jgi:hypothetical protein
MHQRLLPQMTVHRHHKCRSSNVWSDYPHLGSRPPSAISIIAATKQPPKHERISFCIPDRVLFSSISGDNSVWLGWSRSCPNTTHRPRQRAPLFDHPVGVLEETALRHHIASNQQQQAERYRMASTAVA